MSRQIRIAVDIGGTFTDGVAEDASTSAIWVGKCLTTPDDPGEGVSQVVDQLLAQIGADVAPDVFGVVHATTLVTNTLIERRGARTALIVTRGTADVPTIARELRYDLYDLDLELPAPLVPEDLRFEISERVSHDGQIETPLDAGDLAAIVSSIRSANDIEAVAICLLNAHANPEHELVIGQALSDQTSDLSVSMSSRIAAEPGEYERMSTVAANAYVQPLMSRYLGMLVERMHAAKIEAPLRIMLSNGGFTSASAAARAPIQLLESGPAAGVLSAMNAGALAGEDHILAFDMGGTTAKACVVRNGTPSIKYGFETARVKRFRKGSGLPIMIPSIDLIEIGAGGGSIARINRVGTIAVGPESASSVPGPVCYGRGGTEPTVTDADLLLGYLNPDRFLGGEMTLDPALTEAAFARLGAPMGKSATEMAWGVCSVVNEAMAGAARVHIAEHGYDPRDFAMVATGGAGPVHAVDVARRLGVRRVLCPIAAGAGSCLGLLSAAARADRSLARQSLLAQMDWEGLTTELTALRDDALEELRSSGAAEDRIVWTISAQARYSGQGHEIELQLPFDALADNPVEQIEQLFAERYRGIYGMILPEAVIEIAAWRLTGAIPVESHVFRWGDPKRGAEARPSEQRNIFLPLENDFGPAEVIDRYALQPGDRRDGPLILEERESTIVVSVPATITVLDDLTIAIELESGDAT